MAYRVVPDRQGVINVGKLKENLVTEVELPAPGFDGGSYAVLLRRPKEDSAYPVSVRHEGCTLVWTVQTADTAIAGTGKLECRWYGDNGEVAKSQTYMVRITDGLPDPTEAPEAYAGYVEQIAKEAKAAQDAADRAKALYLEIKKGLDDGSFIGPKGDKGDKGDTGPEGPAGPTGAQGPQGEQGPQGIVGPQGPQGLKGDTGPQGEKGEKGDTGAKGDKGDTGDRGPQGEQGVQGDQGPKGDKGDTGDTGPEGPAGKDAQIIDDSTVTQNNPWSSKQILDTLCPPISEAGNPVTCEPVVGYPLGVVASWEPTQAGSGEPYPAGGGPNLLDISKCKAVEQDAAYGLNVSLDGDVITISGTPNVKTYIAKATFRILRTTQIISTDYNAKAFVTKGTVDNVTIIQSDTSIVITSPLSPNTPVSIGMRIMYYTGTEPTAYAPYENIRPISGRDAVNVERCGENLLDMSRVAENKGCTVEGSAIHFVDTSGWGSSYILFAPIYPTGTYTIQVDADVAKHGRFLLRGYDANGNMVDVSILPRMIGYETTYNVYYKSTFLYSYNPSGTHKVIAFTVQGAAYFQVGLAGGISDGETSADFKNFALVPGSAPPTTYTPYRGDTLALALPSTIYGGTVDAVTGAGEQKWGLATFDGSEAWTIGGLAADKRDWYYASPKIVDAINGPPKSGEEICSHYPHYDVANNNTGKGCALVWGGFRVRWGDIIPENTDAWKSYLAAQYAAGTPVQIAYKLAEPVPFQATGAQPIPALAGCNTVLTDADSVTVTGRADPIRIIQQLQAAQSTAAVQLAETQQAVVDTTAMAVDYIYEQDSQIFGGDEEGDDETDTVAADVP